jgi:hypothetical protein
MGNSWKRFLILGLGLILAATLLSLAYVVPIMTTEIDPNLMRPRCPGGKDWDLPGSSCHDGIIIDYILTIDEATGKKLIAEQKKRGR